MNEHNSEEDVWHLRGSLSRNQLTSGSQNTSDGATQQTQALSVVTDANISPDSIDNRTEFSRATLDERDGLKSSSSIFANLRSTLSSVFQMPSNKVYSDDLTCNVILLDGRSVPFTLSTKNAIGRDLLIQVTSYQGLEQMDFFGLTYSINRKYPSSPQPSVSDKAITGSTQEHVMSGEATPTLPVNQCTSDGDTVTTTWAAAYNAQKQTSRSGLNTPTTYRRRRSRTLSYSAWIGDLWSRNHAYVGDVLFWLALDKRISEQCRGPPYIFQFQVKYYIPHPDRDIYCDETRRQYCLQLRHHFLSGRLPCSFNTHVLLGAYISQFVLGDAHPQHFGLDDTGSRSLRSSFSSKLYSRRLSSTMSETQSIVSDRACSLAQPELSDVDNENCDPDEPQSIAWIQSQSTEEHIQENQHKAATLGHVGETQLTHLSVDFSRTCRSESAHSTYLSVLPHLSRVSRSSSIRSIGFRTTADDQLLHPGHYPSLNLTDPEFESPGVNWPYPDPTGYFCPEMLRRIARLHRRLRGMPRSKAECRFLHEVKKLSMYGVELHLLRRVKIEQRSRLTGLYRSLTGIRRSFVSQRASHQETSTSVASAQLGNSLAVPQSSVRFQSLVEGALPFDFNSYSEFAFSAGVCSTCLMLYWGQVRVARFPWSRIVEISLRRQAFLLTVRDTDADSHRKAICFTLVFSSRKLAARFYSSCVDHHKYFRLGVSRPKTSPEACVSTPAISVTGPTPESDNSVQPQSPRARPNETHQHARIRQWLTCLIPRTTERPPSSNRRRFRRLRNAQDRTSAVHLSSNLEQAPSEAEPPAAVEPVVQPFSQSTLAEPWLRRECSLRPVEYMPPDGSSVTDASQHTTPVCVEVDQAQPSRIFWISGSNDLRSDETSIVPTVRRVRSAVTGTQRDLDHRATPSVTRPVSFSAMHKRAVSGRRPPPPPRPKVPPAPLLSNTSYSVMIPQDSGSRSILQNLKSIPIVPTFTAVFTPDGRLVRTSGFDLSVPFDEKKLTAVPLDSGLTDELTQLSTTQQTSTPIPTKRFLIASTIPIVPTRSIRLTFSPSQINAYQILDSVPIHSVNGMCVPLVPTKSVFLRYT